MYMYYFFLDIIFKKNIEYKSSDCIFLDSEDNVGGGGYELKTA